MLDKSFGLLFYLKKPKNYHSRELPIYLRITVDGIPKELSIKISCDPDRWNSSAGRVIGTRKLFDESFEFFSLFVIVIG
jgi:hypothetical protein